MAASVGTISIDLEARLAKFESDMGRAAAIANREMEKTRRQIAGQLRQINGQLEGFASGFTNIFKGVAAGFSVGALVSFEKHLIDVGDTLHDLGAKFGITTEALSVWRLVAEKSGTDLEGIAKGAKILTKDLGDTEIKLKSMGIQLRDTSGNVKSMDVLMTEIAKKFSGYKDGVEKASASSALFGEKIGAELIPFFNDFGKDVQGATDRAQAFGVVIGPVLAEASDKFNDNLRDAKAIAEGFGLAILSKVLPALNELIGSEIDAAAKHRGLISAGEALGNELADTVRNFTEVEHAVKSLIGYLDDLVGSFGDKFPKLAQEIGAAARLLVDLPNLLKGGPAGAVTRFVQQTAEIQGLTGATDAQKDAALRAMIGTKDWNVALTAFDETLKRVAPHIKTKAELDKEAADAARKAREEEEHRLKIAREGLESYRALEQVLNEYYKAQFDAIEEIAKENRVMEEAERLSGLYGDAKAHEENVIRATESATRDYVALVQSGLLPADESILEKEIEIRTARLDGITATQKATAAAEEFAQTWKDAGKQLADAIGGALTGAFKSFKDFGKQLVNIAKQLVSQIISEFLRLRFIQPIINSLLGGGTAGNVAGAFSGGISLAALGSVGIPLAILGAAASTGNRGIGAAGGALAGGIFASTALGAGAIGSGLTAVGLGGVATGALAGSVVPIVGTIIGAVIGAILAGSFGKPKPPEIQVNRPGRVENSQTSPFGIVNINTTGHGQLPSADVGNAIVQFDTAIAQFLSPAQIHAVTARLASFQEDLKGSAATIENILTDRFNAILSTFDQDVQDFVGNAGKLEDRVQRLGDVLQAQATFSGLGLDVTFGQFLKIVTDVAAAGETASQTMQRVVGDTQSLGAALKFMGVDIGKAGDDFVRFAVKVADAAGGLDKASALWQGYLTRFFSPVEIAQKAVDATRTTALSELGDIGITSIPTMEDFRTKFEQALPHLSPAEIVEWLQAGNALADLNDAMNHLNEIAGQGTTAIEDAANAAAQQAQNFKDLNDLINGAAWDDYLAGLDDYHRKLAETQKYWDDLIKKAIDLGASEEQITFLRGLEQHAIDRLGPAIQHAAAVIDEFGNIFYDSQPSQQALDALKSALVSLAKFILSLKVDQNLSNLTPLARLNEAQAQFSQFFTKARSGNVDAINSLPQYAQALLEQARAFYGSGDKYDAIFKSVEASLAQVLNQFGSGSTDPTVRTALTLENYLPSIDAWLSQIAASVGAQPAGPANSYAIGSAGLSKDQFALVHKGEKIIDAQTSAMLDRYGIQVKANGDNDTKALVRDLLQRQSQTDAKVTRLLEQQISALSSLASSSSRRVTA